MRVLVTGASGHVGGAIAAHLANRGHEVVGLSRRPAQVEGLAERVRADLTALDEIRRLEGGLARCDAVVHAAAAVDPDPHAPEVSRVNCLGTQQVLRLAEAWSSARFVYISSVPVIGRPRILPITEEHPPDPPTAYHASKLYGEWLAEIARRRGLSTVTLRLTSPVGPGMPDARILSVFVRRALAGEPLRVAGRGTRHQDYVDVRDVAHGVDACLGRSAEGCFNIAAGRTISNAQLAHRCVKLLDSTSRVELDGRRDPEEGIRWEVSIARAVEGLGYEVRFGIDDSILAVAEALSRR